MALPLLASPLLARLAKGPVPLPALLLFLLLLALLQGGLPSAFSPFRIAAPWLETALSRLSPACNETSLGVCLRPPLPLAPLTAAVLLPLLPLLMTLPLLASPLLALLASGPVPPSVLLPLPLLPLPLLLGDYDYWYYSYLPHYHRVHRNLSETCPCPAAPSSAVAVLLLLLPLALLLSSVCQPLNRQFFHSGWRHNCSRLLYVDLRSLFGVRLLRS
jgi:hypothetical protein